MHTILTKRFFRFEIMNRFLLLYSLSIIITAHSLAQVTTYPVGDNAVIKNFLNDHPNYSFQNSSKHKYERIDSLSLPFFDDFFTSRIYPDSTKWLNNQVYINNGFGKYPPSYNVATFDALAPDGFPYNNTINKDYSGPGDSLISQPINLLTNDLSMPYTLSDSIMLSFYYQPNGNGYHLNNEDSLYVYFKARNGLWFKVWSVGGQFNSTDFAHVIIPITDANYLHGNFQFMFTTFTRQVGNANHWNIDYVLLDQDRKVNVDYYYDYAIQQDPASLLKNYASMPYDHFTINQASQMQDKVYFRISSVYNEGLNIETTARDSFNGSQIYYENETAANNLLAYSSKERFLNIYTIPALPGNDPIVINRSVSIKEGGTLENENKENDKLLSKQIFHDYYAYDDGTAERGFGFDQNTNPTNIEGQIAYGFDIAKKDTLYAISTFFNQAVFDVSGRRFTYRIWKALGGVNGAANDDLIYESELELPVYSSQNGMRTFHSHYLDTTLVVEPGRYYIGWWQQSIYNLNVGWDMNFGNTRDPDKPNFNLYYKAIGDWTNQGLPNGTLMMRPHLGSQRDMNASIHTPKSENKINVFPNPTSSVVSFGKKYELAQLINLSGQVILEASEADYMNVSAVISGIYYVKLWNAKGEQFTAKLVIIAP
jgi:hypothetical protein